jgi:uncharacterized glyoxalase superfamily protein PhnB
LTNPMIAVKDVDASVKFYTEKLGFKLDLMIPDADGTNGFAWVSLDKTGFGLMLVPELEHRGNGVVFMFPVVEGTNVDDYYAQVQKNGVAVMTPIADQAWGDRNFELKDPDGYVLSPYQTMKQMTMDETIEAMQG